MQEIMDIFRMDKIGIEGKVMMFLRQHQLKFITVMLYLIEFFSIFKYINEFIKQDKNPLF